MESLSDYQNKFARIKEMTNVTQRNQALVSLMNELEKEFHTFVFEPTAEELAKPEVILYQEISRARVF